MGTGASSSHSKTVFLDVDGKQTSVSETGDGQASSCGCKDSFPRTCSSFFCDARTTYVLLHVCLDVCAGGVFSELYQPGTEGAVSSCSWNQQVINAK